MSKLFKGSKDLINFICLSFFSDLLNEMILFIFSIFCSALQFLHLYRTTFPSSAPVNYYLIDRFLAIFIAIMSGRRLVYCILERITLDYLCPKKYFNITRIALKTTWMILLFGLLLACCYKIFQKYSFLYIICLSYP